MLHAYRLVYAESPKTPERLWEWEKVHVGRLLWNATAFGRELTHRYFLTWEALAQENQRIWGKYSVNPCTTSENKALFGKSWYKIGHGKYSATRDISLRARAGG